MLHRRLMFILIVILLAVPAVSSAASSRFFPETQHRLSDPMLRFWTERGGLPVFGYPISEAFAERNQDTGATYQTQYFERNRFEAHPENRAPYDVLLGRLGAEALAQQGRDWQTFPKAAPTAPHYFAESGHAIAHAPFWQYWSGHGLEFDGRRGFSAAESLALFGLPLSEPTIETNTSGDTVLTQWFERARFEDHGPKGVLLGLLGNETTTTRRAEPPFLPVSAEQPAPPPTGQDVQWVAQRIFQIFNEVRAEKGLPPYAYRADLQPLANQAIAEWTEVRQAGGDDGAMMERYAAQFTSQTPWASWQYAAANRPIEPGVCRNIDPNDPLAGWRAAAEATAAYRTVTIGVYGPYTGSCRGNAVSIAIIVGQ